MTSPIHVPEGAEVLAEPGAATEDPQAQPAPAKAAADPAKPAADTAGAEQRRANARIAKLEEGLEAANTAAMHWHEQYQTASTKIAQPAGVDDEPADAEPADDLIDVITSGGPKALAKTLKRLGFMTRPEFEAEFEAKAEAKIRGAQSEQDLRSRYPDLTDNESPMFQETARQFRSISETIPKGERLVLAAEKAELALRRAGTWVDVDNDKAARMARVKAQSGDPGRKGGDPADDNGSLSDHQKKMIEQFGISTDAYTKRAKEGIKFSGLRR